MKLQIVLAGVADLDNCKHASNAQLEHFFSRFQRKPLSIAWQSKIHTELGYQPARHIPAAAFSAVFDKLDSQANWLRADPVSLQVDLANVYMLGSAALDLQNDEVDQIVAQVNQHIHNSGMQLHTVTNDRWYLQLPRCSDLYSMNPRDMLGKPIELQLPDQGKQKPWLMLFNELQMLLSSTPANIQRRERGQQCVDALWFWGGGELPESIKPAEYQCVVSKMPVILGMTLHAGIAGLEKSEYDSKALNGYQNCLIATEAFAYDDYHSEQFQQAWQQFWLPVIQDVKTGKIKELIITTENARYHLTKKKNVFYKLYRKLFS